MSPQPGDVGFARTTGVMGRLIRLGEFLRFRRGSGFNHMFVVSDEIGVDGEVLIVQAVLRGVSGTAPLRSVAPGGRYLTVPPPPEADRAKILEFAKSQVGTRYGVGTIIAIAIDIVTWNWFPSFRGARKNSWICSALALEALRYGGWYHPWVDIYETTPAQGYDALVPEEAP